MKIWLYQLFAQFIAIFGIGKSVDKLLYPKENLLDFFPLWIYLLIGDLALSQVLNVIVFFILLSISLYKNRRVFGQWFRSGDIDFRPPLFSFDFRHFRLLLFRDCERIFVDFIGLIYLGLLLLGLVPTLFPGGLFFVLVLFSIPVYLNILFLVFLFLRLFFFLWFLPFFFLVFVFLLLFTLFLLFLPILRLILNLLFFFFFLLILFPACHRWHFLFRLFTHTFKVFFGSFLHINWVLSLWLVFDLSCRFYRIDHFHWVNIWVRLDVSRWCVDLRALVLGNGCVLLCFWGLWYLGFFLGPLCLCQPILQVRVHLFHFFTDHSGPILVPLAYVI